MSVKTYQQLIDDLASKIKTNNNREITAAVLNVFLQDVIESSTLKHIVADASARNALTNKYTGMRVFVEADQTTYILRSNLTTWDNIAVDSYTRGEVNSLLTSKQNREAGKGLSVNDFTNTYKNKLDGVEAEATKNATDAQLRDRTTHTGSQAISTITDLEATLNGIISDILSLEQNGSNISYKNIRLVTDALYEAGERDHTLIVDATDSDKDVVLPDASGANGRILIIKKADLTLNQINLLPFDWDQSESTSTDFQLIEGKVSFQVYIPKQSIVLQARAGRWYVVNDFDNYIGGKDAVKITTKNAGVYTAAEINISDTSIITIQGTISAIATDPFGVPNGLGGTFMIVYKRSLAMGLSVIDALETNFKSDLVGAQFIVDDNAVNLIKLQVKGVSSTKVKWTINYNYTVSKA